MKLLIKFDTDSERRLFGAAAGDHFLAIDGLLRSVVVEPTLAPAESWTFRLLMLKAEYRHCGPDIHVEPKVKALQKATPQLGEGE